MSSALVVAATTASRPGPERVMLNGFGAGAGPAPRIEGAGVADCAASAAVAIAATHKTTNIRTLRNFMGGFYQAGGGSHCRSTTVPQDKRGDIIALCLALGEVADGSHHLLEQRFRLRPVTSTRGFDEARVTEFLSNRVAGLGDAVAAHHDQITWMKVDCLELVRGAGKQPEHWPAPLQKRDSRPVHQDRRLLPRVAVRQSAFGGHD